MRDYKRVFCLCDAIIQNRTNPDVECKRRNELRDYEHILKIKIECKRRNELRDYEHILKIKIECKRRNELRDYEHILKIKIECKRRNELRDYEHILKIKIECKRRNELRDYEHIQSCKRRNELRDYKRGFWYYSSAAVCCFSAAICSTIHPFHIQWMCLLAVSIRFFDV